jgi:hypothetical protein
MTWSQFDAWLRAVPREARILVITLCGLSTAVALFLVALASASISQSWSEMSRSEPKIARLKGYQASEQDMVELASETALLLRELAFSSESDESQTGARLQQALRGFAEDAGMTIRGSQLVSGGRAEAGPDGFMLLTVELQMRGLPAGLTVFLRDVYDHSPLLKVSKISIVKVRDRRASRRRDQGSAEPEQNLDVNIQITALMVSA